MDQREEKCIEFVLRTIEKRLMKNRSNVWRPEENRDTPSDRRIDAVARIGGQDFALEHTMVEPYEGHYKQGVVTQKARIYLWKQLEKFDLKVGIDIALPNGLSTLYPKQKQREKFIRALASLIREKQSEIESLGDDDRFYEIGVIGENPIKVVRNGFEKIGEDTRPDLLSMAGDYQKRRPDRIQRSLDDKLPKLIRWGKDHQTVLILENRDISLTSWRSVRPVIEELWSQSGVIPVDYLYFVNTPIDMWRIFPFVEARKWVPAKPNGLVRLERIDSSDLLSPFC